MDLVGYAASLLMGVTLGLLGGGGSILTVPIFVYLFSVAPAQATGYSLLVVGLTSAIGASIYLKRGDVNFGSVVAFAIPSIIGVNVSRGLILPRVPETIAQLNSFVLSKDTLIMATFAALMLLASYSMFRGKASAPKPARGNQLMLSTLGGGVGLVVGFVGAGGGFLINPALVTFAGLAMRNAVGTSLTIIAIQSLVGVAGDVLRGAPMDWALVMTVSGLSIFGIAVGSLVSHRIDEKMLKTAFAVFVMVMGAFILIQQAQII